MQLKQLFADEDAVSPVIGVILMVAITVILAAVIGTFVLGLGQNMGDNAPSVSFQFSEDGGDVTVEHKGGDSVESENVEVLLNGSPTTNQFAVTEITAGNSITISGVSSGDEIRVVWTSDDGGTTSTIGQYTVS